MKAQSTHISVCIATLRRVELLDRALDALVKQERGGYSYSVVVVDNDAQESARALVRKWQRRIGLEIQYHVEPARNISLARNRAVSSSRGDLVAFIDDDETPERHWLSTLYNCYRTHEVDGVLGPVIPSYRGLPPSWLVRSGLCVRPSFRSGTILVDPKFMRTGNVLFSRHIIGGEDTDFFARMLRKGFVFVWCNEACVHEEVPAERQTRTYYLQRAMIRGVTTADREALMSVGTLKSIVASLGYTLSLPFMLAAGQHLFMKYLVKDLDHVAKLLAHLGVRVVRERTF